MATSVRSKTYGSKAPSGSGLSDEEFVEFVDQRPNEERWQLIDGEAIMMTPPTLRHQRIASNLAMKLNLHFERRASPLYAFQEVGLMVPGVKRFRPKTDLAVVDSSIDLGVRWANHFLLAGEVLSESNSAKEIENKCRRYIEHPDNLYVLVIAQNEVCLEVRSRRSDWRPVELRSLEDKLELPEFEFSTTLLAIYAGTPIVAVR